MQPMASGIQQLLVEPMSNLLVRTPRTAPVNACPMCEATETKMLFELSDQLHGVPGRFIYRRCCSCKTVFQDPRVIQADLELCYPDEYYTHTRPQENNLVTGATEISKRRLHNIRDILRRSIAASVQGDRLPGLTGLLGRLLALSRTIRERTFYGILDEMIPRDSRQMKALEVGCGLGFLMIALQRAGWDVEGVEWDSVAAQVARNNSNRSVIVGDFRTAEIPQAIYNLVVLHHVFEHIDDPHSALHRIAELLAPGGHAVLVYPNPKSLGAKVFKADWFPWEAPRHLVLPTARALAMRAREAGLAATGVRTITSCAEMYYMYSRAFRAGKPISLAQSSKRDRILASLSRTLVRLKFSVGEELVVILTKPH